MFREAKNAMCPWSTQKSSIFAIKLATYNGKTLFKMASITHELHLAPVQQVAIPGRDLMSDSKVA